MAGRDLLPGEDETGYAGLRDSSRYMSRIVRGQITSVDPPNGTAQVNTVEVFGTRRVTVPPIWFSGKGRQAAWGRYMPFGGENVHIEYRNDNTPVVVGYDINFPGEQQDEGWAFLKQLADDGVAGYAVFRELRPGEFDFKSSGDAYIHGSSQGTLYLSGGQAFIKLDKQAYRLESKASEYHYSSETAQIRFGTVFRLIVPTDQAESPVNSGTYKEFLVDVNYPLPSGTPSVQSRAKLHLGDILDSTNAQEKGPEGNPLRMRLSLGNALDALEVFSLLIDDKGNMTIEHSQPGTTVNHTIDQTAIEINGVAGEFFISKTGSSQVAVAIADYLQQLWTQLKTAMDTFDTHIHPTGVGPSGPPTPLAAIPSWDTNINSVKMKIPDNT